MKTVGMMLLCLLLSGCSSLILRDDDTTGDTVAKVATRSLLVLPTLLWSEVFIQRARLNEEWAAKQAEQAMYFGKECEKEGYATDTPEHASCLSVKRDQLAPAGTGGGVGVLVMPPAPRHSTTCYSGGTGRYVTCY